ncbi:MAG: 30S ribosomal protein S15 [Candidatus Diapherotrites archaeon]|uniref:Small ribosomal subunit protein uS15 n=1 Tax=Candidatus Iainarchaeum sp. TaxID=3101447 RepID=A0A2D6M0J5_9ARCH|nr:30S ribosomal protein S15 [Candidatus Diapherotrites archaeon]|tara:strand:+ start:158 stop:613 length:456 start_codon:yes stop_codon:yes gene_type:complete
MARMHSGKKGKSKSTKPPVKKAPSWVELKPKEVIEAVINLANAGHSQSEIGSMLRDQYGVPDIKAVVGKGVEDILKDNKLLGDIPEDLMNLIRKSVTLKKHQEKNKKDFTAKRGYQLTVSKIRRLTKYYRKTGKLPKTWRYSEETAALLVK